LLSLGQQVVIQAFARELVDGIKDAIKNKPIDRVKIRIRGGMISRTHFKAPVYSSGELYRSIKYVLTDTNLSIYANDYIYELIWGVPPNKDNKVSDSSIKKWIRDKGIEIEKEDEDTIASLITRKIRDYGSSIYLAHYGKNSGLLENIVNDQMINSYNVKFTQQLKEDFIKAFKDGK
jgi:hypothetical protein